MRSNYGPFLVTLVMMATCLFANPDNSTVTLTESTRKSTLTESHSRDLVDHENETIGTFPENVSPTSAKPQDKNVNSGLGKMRNASLTNLDHTTSCFQCRSDVDFGCGEGSIPTEYLKPCNLMTARSYQDIELSDNIFRTHHIYCRKVVQYLKFMNNTPVTITARECTLYHKNIEHCYREKTQAFTLSVCECNSEGCNASTFANRISRLLLLIAVSLVVFRDFPP